MPGDPNPGRTAALKEWEAVFGSPPPAYLSVTFIQRAIGYQRQCKSRGGLPVATRRALKRIAAGENVAAATPLALSPNSHLVREWNGRSYQVSVMADGFEMDGEWYSSLSAIAKHITGTNWSGPRFFGVSQGSRE